MARKTKERVDAQPEPFPGRPPMQVTFYLHPVEVAKLVNNPRACFGCRTRMHPWSIPLTVNLSEIQEVHYRAELPNLPCGGVNMDVGFDLVVTLK